MAKKVDIVLHSDYAPETCLAKLSSEIDTDPWTLFPLSGYTGYAPVLGRISGNEFRLHKRRHGHNSFGPVLFGRVQADGRGALVEAYWGKWPVSRFFMRMWLILAAVIGTPIFLMTVQDLVRHGFAGTENWGIGLIVPPGLALLGVLSPRLGAALSFPEKRYVLEFLEKTLVASPMASVRPEGSWRSAFDRL
jgi:hypothetical protein